MRPHAAQQARRLATLAERSRGKRRKRYEALSKKWAARAIETDTERVNRIDREYVEWKQHIDAVAAKKAERRAVQHERLQIWQEAMDAKAGVPSAPRKPLPARIVKKRRQIGPHPSSAAQMLRELRAERQRHRELNLEAALARKRDAARLKRGDAPVAVPPLPYAAIPPLPY